MSQDLPPDRRARSRAPEPRSFLPSQSRKANGDGRDSGGWNWRGELARFWPQIVFALTVAFGVGAFQALASDTDRDHDARLKVLEAAAPLIARDLGALRAQGDRTEKTVDRMEDKIDRLMERTK